MVTIGDLGGKLETGRALDYFESGDDNRKLCSLYLGIMDRMGVELAALGFEIRGLSFDLPKSTPL